MSAEQRNNVSGLCLKDLLRMEASSTCGNLTKKRDNSSTDPRRRLEYLLSEEGNGICADCGTPDPKWVSLSLGVFVCIKCSGVHRSLGVHITKVLSVKLDEWTNDQVDLLKKMGGNTLINLKYEANLPESYRKPKPDSSNEERSDFIRRKYEQQQFLDCEELAICPYPSQSPSNCHSTSCSYSSSVDKKVSEKQFATNRFNNLGSAFRNSWKRNSEHRSGSTKKSNSMAGMIEFIGLIKVNVVRGTNLAVRDVMTSDPYVILSLGHQSVKTRVIKNNLNPVWNEKLMLSIPETVPPLKLLVYDKDTFSTDDFMGEAEIDIQPLVSAAKASETSTVYQTAQVGTWKAGRENTLVKDGIITLEGGSVKQEIALKLQNVERGVLEIGLECVPLTQ